MSPPPSVEPAILADPSLGPPLGSALGPLQSSTPGPLAVVGTIGLLALFFSLTAHLAARNVLGDVAPTKALGVGPVPAVVSVLTQVLSIPGAVGVVLALALDGAAIHYLYGRPRRTSAYVTAIHAVVSIILGSIVFAAAVLILSAPG